MKLWRRLTYLNPKNCPESLPSEVKVAEVTVTLPLIFLGEISPKYIKWRLPPKPATHVTICNIKGYTATETTPTSDKWFRIIHSKYQ